MSPFDFQDYKEFLLHKIKENHSVRGYQGMLARAAGCQASFFSQVLNAAKQLSREQAAALCDFWSLDIKESDYFLTLLDLARAGNESLRLHCKQRLGQSLAQRKRISSRVTRKPMSDLKRSEIYYSSWRYAAIHVAVSVQAFQTAQNICARLRLPLKLVQQSLESLERLELVKRHGNRWLCSENDIHLPDNSVLTAANHGQWRHRALANISEQDSDALHFSSVFAISRKDAAKIRESLLELVIASRNRILKSKEEDVYSLCCDFFRI